MKLLKGGTIIDPAGELSGPGDILIKNGKIAKVGANLSAEGAEVIDASGLMVAPGLVDLHVHFRDPGYEYKETVETGLRAAAAGGFTSVVCMPNTSPAIDNNSIVKYLNEKCEEIGLGRLFVAGAATKGRKGEELSEIAGMVEEGIVCVTDDGSPVANDRVMRSVLEYTKIFGIPVMSHAEAPALFKGGVMHEGLVSTTIGLPGIPLQAETIMVERDIQLAELTGGRLHLTHLSAAGSIEAVRNAKKRGLKVTCDVTPHHLTLTDEAALKYDTSTKVNPPLRPSEHVDALIAGLLDGTVDAIASDHAPHAVHEKETSYMDAPFGLVGLETSLAVLITKLVKTGKVPLETLIQKLTSGAAAALGLNAGTLAEGAPADIVAFDPDAEWTVDPSKFQSLGRNCPFAGWKVFGAARITIAGGKVIYRDGEICDV